jgi:hypothetical protein
MNRAFALMLAGVVAVAVLSPRRASAMGAVVGPSGSAIAISSVRIAVASVPGRTTRWAQISVNETAGAFVWLVPLSPGALVDLASNAWLDALDAATTPVVLPPDVPSDCDVALGPQAVAPVTSPSSLLPASTWIALDASTLTTNLSGQGFAVPDTLTAGITAAFSTGMAVLALEYPGGALPVHTLRIVDNGPPTLPFSLTGSSSGDVAVTAFVVAGSAEEAGGTSLVLNPAGVLWQNEGGSNYESALRTLLARDEGKRWFTESAMPGILFQKAVTAPGSSVTLPAVLDTYYALAKTYGDTTTDPSSCVSAADDTENDTSSYMAACPAGALAVVPGTSPCDVATSGQASVDPLVCGASAVDGALAVAGLTPESIWVTRIVGLVTPTSATDVPLLEAGSTAKSAVVSAGGYASACSGEAAAPPGAFEGSSFGDDAGDYGEDAGGDAHASGDDGTGSGVTTVVVTAPDPSADDDTGSCDGDSSGSGDDSGGCSGNTNSNDDSDGCSNHTSSSDDSGGGCSNSNSGGNNDCSTSRHGRRGKSPVSRALMLTAVALGIARRHGHRVASSKGIGLARNRHPSSSKSHLSSSSSSSSELE